MQPEQIQNFKERLNQWIANQGFWFQIRYALLGGGFGGYTMFHLVRITLRLGIFLILLTSGSWIYMIKKMNSAEFRGSLETNLRKSLSVTDLTASSSRSTSRLEINRLIAEGSRDTFFSFLDARNIRCRMPLTYGLSNTWKPGVVTISQLDLDLRAGADDSESATKIAKVIFTQSPDVFLRFIDITKANLRWGFSPPTRGSVNASHLKMHRTGSGWKIILTGGTFTQNWLKNLTIIRIVAICQPDGLYFQEASLRKDNATIDFSGLHIAAADRPVVRGSVRIRNLNLKSFLPPSHFEMIDGSISTELTVSGSTNSSEGLAFEGTITLEGSDSISLSNRIHLLRALSVVDNSNSYHRMDFNKGSFAIKSVGNTLQITDIDLKADELLFLSGHITIRLPDNDEVNDAIQKGLLADSYNYNSTGNETPLTPGNRNPASPSKRPAVEANLLPNGIHSIDNKALLERLKLNSEMRILEANADERLSRLLHYQGNLEVSLLPAAFEQTPKLKQKYPVNPDSGRIRMPISIDGHLNDLTLQHAESIYKDGQR